MTIIDRQSSRMRLIKPSPSMAVSQAAKRLKAQGEDVIDLGLGEPDFDTPAHIVDAAFEAARNGATRYTATDGGPEVKAAICAKLARENGLDYQPAEIIVSNGAKQVIFNALFATVEPGDEVLIVAPYFVSYPDMALMAGAVPKVVMTSLENGFRVTPDDLEAAITPKTRWVLLNMPGNPSGASYSNDDLQALGAVLERHDQVLVLSDEIYEHILFDGRSFTSFARACPALRDRTLTVNGVSKAYAMTGWRIGYGAGPVDIIRAMTKVQSQSTTNASSVSQAATVAALTGPQDFVQRSQRIFQQRRDAVVQAVNRIPGLKLAAPDGAFYAFIECAAYIGARTPEGQTIHNDADLVGYLLASAKVAAVHGAAYGMEPYFRISTALNEAVLLEAIRRIGEALASLTRKELL